jgi:hypothetical protein
MATAMKMADIYYIDGVPKRDFTRYHYAITKNPPTSGWSRQVVLLGPDRSTIFCPYTFWSADVPNRCAEIMYAKPAELRPDKLVKRIYENWELWKRHKAQVDYDVAALVLTQLGASVPITEAAIVDDTQERKSRGGKAMVTEALKPVKRGSKRGIVLEFFLGKGPRSLREAMATLSMSRNNVLTHLFILNKEHGIAYSLSGDAARVEVPEGYDPFKSVEAVAVSGAPSTSADVAGGPSPATSDAGGPRADPSKGKPAAPERHKPIRRDSKRGAVVEAFINRWADVAAYAQAHSLTKSGVMSHLHTIWTEHGLAHEVTSDGTHARLLVPDGFVLWRTDK